MSLSSAGRGRARAAILAVAGLLDLSCLAGCGTLPNGRRWGGDVTFLPSGKRLGRAAWNALKHPMTWAPLAGAAVLQIDDWDENLSEWAVEETPIFGSVDDAKDARGWTGNLSDLAYFASVLATPSGEDAAGWAWAKAKGFGVGGAARLTSLYTGDFLKSAVGRERPDASSDTSFPSQHASGMAVNATLTIRNLDSVPLADGVRYTLDAGVVALTAVGSWSRLEAGQHFPSDVLAGVALGHFLGRFFDEAFMGLEEGPLQVQPVATLDRVGIAVTYRF